MWNELRAAGHTQQAAELKGTRWALLKNPANQTGSQRTTVAAIATLNKPLYRSRSSYRWCSRPKAGKDGRC